MGLVADVQTFLVAQGLVDGSTGWPSVRRFKHDDSDQLVVITEDGGREPELPASSGIGDAALGDPAVHVMVRAGALDSDAAGAKAQAILDALHGHQGSVGSTTPLRVQSRTAEPIFAGFDENNRPEFTTSFRFLIPVTS